MNTDTTIALDDCHQTELFDELVTYKLSYEVSRCFCRHKRSIYHEIWYCLSNDSGPACYGKGVKLSHLTITTYLCGKKVAELVLDMDCYVIDENRVQEWLVEARKGDDDDSVLLSDMIVADCPHISNITVVIDSKDLTFEVDDTTVIIVPRKKAVVLLEEILVVLRKCGSCT